MLRAPCPYAPARPGLDELVGRHAPQVKRIACHLLARLPASVQIDDLIQAGMLGLIEAARRYDASQGASFATFAEQRIRGAMLDEIRRGDWTPRSVHRRSREVAAAIRAIETETGREAQDVDVALRLGLSLPEYHDTLTELRGQKLVSLDDDEHGEEEGEGLLAQLASTEAGPEEETARDQLLGAVSAQIDVLPEREKLVLALYYDEGLNLKEIGAVLGVSESRVCQIHAQAVARLRSRLR